VTRANLGFIGVLVATLLICTYIPAVPLVLVDLFYR
jgi:C4-dicarboxylate transporter, DctM subunit